MQICYIDESGCTGVLPSDESPIQPVFVLGGLIVDSGCIRKLTHVHLQLKQRYMPGEFRGLKHALDGQKCEMKGSEIRKHARKGSRNQQRRARRILDDILGLFESCGARVIGRILIKGIGVDVDGAAVYTSAIQDMARHFQAYLCAQDDRGVIVIDSRSPQMNSNLSHSIFTRKFKVTGDEFDRIIEMPFFGHSENHAGIQLADYLCSGILFPMAVGAYCHGLIRGIHIDEYLDLRSSAGPRLKSLQYRYQDSVTRHWRGGVTTNDQLAFRKGSLLFSPPPNSASLT